tara:strand:+ start:495 stop:824 length:330 start_codon:yes stop_codon:yes gene_type:complete
MIIGYSNLLTLLSTTKFFDELSTNKLAIRINTLKKLEKVSLIKLSRKILVSSVGEFKIINIVIINIAEDKLKTKLKLLFTNTPIIKIEKIDKVKKISGNNMFKLLIIIY